MVGQRGAVRPKLPSDVSGGDRDLGEQRFAGRRLGRRGCFLLALEPVDRLDDEEQHPGDDREIDELGEERAIAKTAPCRFASTSAGAFTFFDSGTK